MKMILLLLCCFAVTSLNAQKSGRSYTLNQVPDPKVTGTGYVSDPDDFISSADESELNRLIADMEDSTTAQVAVVVLGSIGEESPKEFATALFNKWGIGQADIDNGLLILVVMDQRRTEFETGYGLEGVLPDVVCYRVGMQELVPYFQQGKFGAGLIAAVVRFKDILENPESVGEIYSEDGGQDAQKNKREDWLWFLSAYGIMNVLAHAWALIYIFYTLNSKQDLYDKYLSLRHAKSILMLILFPVPFILVFMFVKKKLQDLRYQPRYSKKTGELMHVVPEKEEDEYLEKGMVTEEEIGVADYDVWATEAGDDIMILRYAKSSGRYSRCPSCNFVTYYHAESVTLQAATYSSSGRREETYRCKNCDYLKRKTVTIPKLQRTTSSSGGSSWSGGSSGSSSWGGGRSGGGGSGVSW